MLFLGWLNSINAQAGHETRLDAEFELVCLVDSISATNQVQFWRKYFINSDLYQDKRFDLVTNYTVTGTVLPCVANKVCGPYSPSFENVTTSKTILANTANSVSIAALTGTVTVQTGADPAVTLDSSAKEVLTIPAADACNLIPTQIIVTVTGGNAHVITNQ